MIILSNPNETIKLVTTTNASIDYNVSYADITSTSFFAGSSQGNISSATTTTLIPAPTDGTTRQTKIITIRNKSITTSGEVTLYKDVSGTAYYLPTVYLVPGDTLSYFDGTGFKVFAANGAERIGSSFLTNHAYTHLVGGSDALPVATESIAGLMTAANKVKLDGIPSTISGDLYNSGQTLIAYSNAVQSNLNTETTNRSNADITLQSNINTLSGLTVANENALSATDVVLSGSIVSLSGTMVAGDASVQSQINTLSGLMITETSVSTLTNKTITGLSNKVEAAALLTATGEVYVSGSVAPTSGQVLIANSATNATWQTQIQTLNGLSTQSQTFAVGTAGTTFNVSSTGSTHTFNIPNASTTSSGLVTVGAQTFAGVKTFQDNSLQVQNPAHTFAYILSGSAITADRNLILPVISQDEFVAIRPAILQSSPANPTGTTSTTGVMMGLAGALTPRVTGRVKIVINGYMSESVAARGVTAQIRYGTGTAPVNGAALTGTTAGGDIKMFQTSATELFPFSCNAIVSGLTLGTAIWIDLAVARVGASGTGSVLNISITAFEL